jgi:hypothetical protein
VTLFPVVLRELPFSKLSSKKPILKTNSISIQLAPNPAFSRRPLIMGQRAVLIIGSAVSM